MTAQVARIQAFFREEVWRRDAWWVRVLQLGVMIVQGFVRDQLLLRAHSLTYITILSLIPLVALGLSMVGLLGFRERVAAELYGRVGVVAPEVATQLRTLVDSFDFGSLGALGGTVLLVTTILTVGSVERSFNHVWGVTQQRPWMRRFPDYLFVILIAPVVLGFALSLGATLQSPAAVGWLQRIPGFETLYRSGLRQIPVLLFVSGFAFLYWFLPNTRVRPLSALVGGVVAGLLFPVALWAYVSFSVGAGRWGAIYGGFAQVPMFLVFAYLAWTIVLLGAEVAFAHQHLGRYRREVQGAVLGPAAREALCLAVALEVAARFEMGEDPWTADGLADHLGAPIRTVRELLEALTAAGLVVGATDAERGETHLLGRPAERICVGDVLAAVRGPRALEAWDAESESPTARVVTRTLEELDKRQREVSERDTLADLLQRCAST